MENLRYWLAPPRNPPASVARLLCRTTEHRARPAAAVCLGAGDGGVEHGLIPESLCVEEPGLRNAKTEKVEFPTDNVVIAHAAVSFSCDDEQKLVVASEQANFNHIHDDESNTAMKANVPARSVATPMTSNLLALGAAQQGNGQEQKPTRPQP